MSDTKLPSVLCIVAADERPASLVAAFDEGVEWVDGEPEPGEPDDTARDAST